jgi:hypothetical protein
VDLPQRSVAAGQPVRLAADVVDEAYEPLGGATVRLTVESPLGERARYDLEWLTGFEGRYGASFVPTESGRYDLRVALLEGERVVAAETASVYATGSGREFYDAELDAPALRRLAQETGGRYYDAADAAALPGAIAPAAGGRRVIQRLPLWDAPVLYVLIVALAGAEWFLRRRRRLR